MIPAFGPRIGTDGGIGYAIFYVCVDTRLAIAHPDITGRTRHAPAGTPGIPYQPCLPGIIIPDDDDAMPARPAAGRVGMIHAGRMGEPEGFPIKVTGKTGGDGTDIVDPCFLIRDVVEA